MKGPELLHQKKERDMKEKKVEGFKKLEKAPRDNTFGCPDWVEDNVIPLGERGAILWRHLRSTWKSKERMVKKEWEKFSPDIVLSVKK